MRAWLRAHVASVSSTVYLKIEGGAGTPIIGEGGGVKSTFTSIGRNCAQEYQTDDKF